MSRAVPGRAARLPLLLAASLALGGCVAGIAAGAVGAVVGAATRPRPIEAELRPAAIAACSARAAQHGEVHIIDPERHPDGRVTVWGTVTGPGGRRAFRCRFDGEIRAFRLRAIPPP